MNRELADEAKRLWDTGQSLEAGRLLYEHIPAKSRPIWAASVLVIAQRHVSALPEVETILAIANDPSRWREASDAFWAIRELTLQAKDPLCEGVLTLAENVAKVIYNSSGHSPLFDHDSGWWIAQNLKYITEQINDPDFAAEAWLVLVARNLDNPGNG